MDWGNVTFDELADALKEVEWQSPPRPLAEFFAKFTPPKTRSKWESRVKCNIYYYRANYFLLMIFVLCVAFIRNPLAFIAALVSGFGLACLNDSFAISLSEKITRATRKISPPLAAKMRPPVSAGVRGRPLDVRGKPLKGAVYICGRDRRIVVLSIISISALFWYISSGFRTVFGALAFAILFSGVHATFRSPNLKARLNSYREEFRAVWRGYSDA